MGSTLEGTRPRSCPLTAPFHFFSTRVLQTAYQGPFPYKKLYDPILIFDKFKENPFIYNYYIYMLYIVNMNIY